MDKKPSMLEIARAAGVGKTTVSLALRDDPRISLAQRQRVQEVARTMGYQTNALVSRLMHELRNSRLRYPVATLALVNCSRNVNIRKEVDTPDDWCLGVEQRAAQLGYSVDAFWLHEPGIVPSRLLKIFQTRKIQGAVFYAMENVDALRDYEPVWSNFPCVTVGVRISQPHLHFVANDHFATGFGVADNLLRLGYSRIGMIIDGWLDVMLGKRFVAGFRTALDGKPQRPILRLQGWLAKDQGKEKLALERWLDKNAPEACVVLNAYIYQWILELGFRVPDQLGVALLDVTRSSVDRFAGMKQQPVSTGMAAVDLLIGQIIRRETGVPPFQKGTLIESVWAEGPTVANLRSSQEVLG